MRVRRAQLLQNAQHVEHAPVLRDLASRGSDRIRASCWGTGDSERRRFPNKFNSAGLVQCVPRMQERRRGTMERSGASNSHVHQTSCALAVAAGVWGCGGTSSRHSGQTASPRPTESKAGTADRFDGLTITLELKGSSVPSRGEVGSSLTVRNDSGETIVDPSCLIGAGRYALVPVDDPDAELWLQPVVVCSGNFEVPDGFIERSAGPTFPARTKHGEALPPGDYIATLEIEGYSDRLEEPIEVTG